MNLHIINIILIFSSLTSTVQGSDKFKFEQAKKTALTDTTDTTGIFTLCIPPINEGFNRNPEVCRHFYANCPILNPRVQGMNYMPNTPSYKVNMPICIYCAWIRDPTLGPDSPIFQGIECYPPPVSQSNYNMQDRDDAFAWLEGFTVDGFTYHETVYHTNSQCKAMNFEETYRFPHPRWRLKTLEGRTVKEFRHLYPKCPRCSLPN